MRKKISYSILSTSLLIFLLVPLSPLNSQDKLQKPSRQSALEAFSKDNFEFAYNQFTELSALYPKDPLYKYYCGVCLVKLNRDPGKAASLLQDAMLESASIRMVPDDDLFYLGRARQMNGNFSEAIESYNNYTEKVGKKASKNAGVAELIQQCNEKKGKIAAADVRKQVLINKDSVNKPSPVTLQKIEKPVQIKIDSLAKQKNQVPEIYDTKLSQALDYQFKADSLSGLVTQLRKKIETSDNSEKADLKTQLQNLEQLAFSNQKIADQMLAEAQRLTIKGGIIRPDTVKVENIAPKNLPKADSVTTVKVVSKPGTIKDTVIVIKEKQPEKTVTKPADAQVKKVTDIFSIFEVIPKPVYPSNEFVKVNPEVPPGLIYRIQLAVFRNPVSPSYFKGITPVFGIKNTGADLTNYYAGMFRKSEDAVKALTKVKALGFKDAFVVALSDKNIVSTDRAVILEKEWGTKSLISQDQKTTVIPRDTVPPTLVFRVEVIRSVKPLSSDQLENIKKLAGSRGLEIIVNESKQNIYLIGKFLTFETASEYADLLIRNGLKESKVVAYLGKREIPVETAKQLFEKY
jgi:hypothetical protein